MVGGRKKGLRAFDQGDDEGSQKEKSVVVAVNNSTLGVIPQIVVATTITGAVTTVAIGTTRAGIAASVEVFITQPNKLVVIP